jgi:hypothetical protein
MALTRIQPPALADVREPNFRNIIINGDMAVSQRATSAASVATQQYPAVDRFQFGLAGTMGTWTFSQDTDVPTGQGFANSFKMDCTTADASPAAADAIRIAQIIEGQNLQYLKKGTSSAVPLTLSFWVKSVLTGTYIAELYDVDNTRQVSKSYTISSASTWEYKTITFPADTTGAFTNDNNASLYLNFFVGAGTDYTSGSLNTSWAAVTNANRAVGQVNLANSTSNNFWITGIQMEAGSVATDFEVNTFAQNLERCRRYALVLGDAPGGAAYDTFFKGVIGHYYNATDFYPNFNFPIVMRSVPGTTFSTASSGFGTVYSNGSGRANTSNGTNATYETNINFRVSTASATAGDGGAFDFAASNYVILSAEL